MSNPEQPTPSCLNCPSYLKPEETIDAFGKSIGAPMCGRFGHVLGKPGIPKAQEKKLGEHFAKSCPQYMAGRPSAPQDFRMQVMLPDPVAREQGEKLAESDNLKKSCSSCGSCKNFVREDVTAGELGWTTGLCSAKGKLILSTRQTKEAQGCEYRVWGGVRQTTDGLHLLPEYEHAFGLSADPQKAYFKQKEAGGPVDPSEYVTDQPVSDEEKAAGVRAWRAIGDPDGSDNVIFLPIYDADFFTEDERKKIPQSGDDEHPELYIDHFGGVYGVGVAWTELDETPALWGVAGTGKTELYRYAAWLMQLPFERMSITASTELDDLMGKMKYTPAAGTYFEYGRLALAWQKPCVLGLDEPNTGPLDVWQACRPLFDNSKQLVLDMNKAEHLERHTDCYPGLAMNPAWDPLNAGALQLADADANRLFHMHVPMPPDDLEREIIQNRVKIDGWQLDSDQIEFVMKIAEEVRDLSKEGTLPITWAIRPQLKVARALRWFSPVTAYRRAVGDFLDPEQQEVLLDVVSLMSSDQDMLAPLPGDSEELDARARRSVAAFRKLQPTLTAYAKVLTKRNDVRAQLSSTSNGETDGKNIYFRPPLELGDRYEHNRSLCDKRDVNHVALCPACKAREKVLVGIYHEIAHIAYETFAPVSDNDKKKAIERSLRVSGSKYAKQAAERIADATYFEKRSYLDLANLINAYMPALVNGLEDARVNRELFRARKGTKAMFNAEIWQVFTNGFESGAFDGSVTTNNWKEAPVNSQITVGAFTKAAGYDYSGWFSDEALAVLDDPEVTRRIRKMDVVRTASGSVDVAFSLLERFRELGYLKTPDEIEEPPIPEPDPEADPDEEQEPESGEDSDESEGDDEGEGDSDQTEPGDGDSEGDGSDEDQPEQDSTEGGGEGNTPDPDGESSDDQEGEGDEPGEGQAEPSDSQGDDTSDEVSPDEAGEASGGDGDEPSEDEGGSSSEEESGDGGVDDEPTTQGSGGEAGEDSDESSHEDGDPQAGSDGDAEDSVPDSDASEEGDSREEGDSSEEQPDGDSDSDAEAGDDAGDSEGEGGQEGSSDGDVPSEPAEGSEGDDGSDPSLSDGEAGQDDSGSSTDGGDGEPDSGLGADPAADDASGSPESDSDRDPSSPESLDGDSVPESEDEQDSLIDSGADRGEGGITQIDDEAAEEIPMGDPKEAMEAVTVWTMHDEPPKTAEEKAAEDNALERAIVQGIYFETPSRNIFGVREHHFDQPIITEGYNVSAAWYYEQYSLAQCRSLGIDPERVGETFDPDEKLIGAALTRARVAFTDNQRGAEQRHRKSGRVDARVLGKRVKFEDDRLFKKKILPGKKDYFVILSMDLSGSTIGANLVAQKRAVLAQAAMLDRLGVKFAVYGHTGVFHDPTLGRGEGIDLDVFIVKEPDEPWTERQAHRLKKFNAAMVNLDGHMLEWLRKKADTVTATDKIIMYYTDGKMPAENEEEELEILQREIRICKNKGIYLMEVGIRTDSPVRHGLDTVQIDEPEDIVKVVRHLEKRLKG